jgi:VWFA-related protein
MTLRLMLLGAACAGLVQAPTFKTALESVRVDVLATQDGRPLRGLGPADFEVFDEGVLQRLDHVTFEQTPLKVVFAIDASSSLGGERGRRLREACQGVLTTLHREDQAALVVFSDGIFIRSALTRDLDRVRDAVEQTLPPGQTALVDAIQASLLLAESEPGRGLLLVLSDGIEVSSHLSEEVVLESAKRSEAVVYGVSLRADRKPRLLDRLADITGGDLVRIESSSDLAHAFEKVLTEFRQRYLLSFVPTGVSASGWHQLKVRVKRDGVSVRARPGYYRQ